MKVDGSLASLVQGVSQQTPGERRPGQHGEQINMLADPVRGLSRRHGTQWQAERDLNLLQANAEANLQDSDSYRSFDYTNAGRELTVLYRSGAKPIGSDLPPVIVYDKTGKQFLSLTRNVTDVFLDLLSNGGVSAVAATGKYVFLAGNTILPQAISTGVWADATNQARSVLWVRGGAYSRTYKATVTRTDNSQVTFQYTTPASSFSGALDTSGVPVYAADPAGGTTVDTEAAYIVAFGASAVAALGWSSWNPTGLSVKNGAATMTNVHPGTPAAGGTQYAWGGGTALIAFHADMINQLAVSLTYTHTKTIANPNYAKQVGDLTNAFNTNVTNWIGSAASQIQPENIADSLRAAALLAGLVGVTRSNATVVFTNVKDITATDSGDGTLLRGLANTVQSVADLTDEQHVGKVVRVSPTGGESFYMKAEAKNASITSGVTSVRWVEGAGISRSITDGLCYGVADGTTFYLASSAALLATILPGDHPVFAPGTVGDDDSGPLPFFIGRRISYLGVFQDRLLVGAGAVIRASKVGDYLNFFRGSVLTVQADDPFEMLSQGSEDDTIRFGALYDRDLILFGKRQYAVSGRTALTPTSANMPVMSSHEGANDAQPVAAGGLIFYAKQGQSSTSVQQIEPGRNAESPESYAASSQLDDYMPGSPAELAVVPKPTTLLVRTSGARNTLFVLSYLDTQERRVQDCWHRWNYPVALGPILGTSIVREGVLVFTLRQGLNISGTFRQWAVCDLQPLDGQLSSRPYLDSTRLYSAALAAPGSLHVNLAGDWRVAFDASSDARFIGGNLSEAAALLIELPEPGLSAGIAFESRWQPTNPQIRDAQDRPINTGRLTVTSLLLAFRDSSGFASTVTAFGADTAFDFNGRILGDVNNIVGEVPVTTGKQSVVVGREAGEYTQVIKANTWLPLNLTSVDWTGQLFHRPRRVG